MRGLLQERREDRAVGARCVAQTGEIRVVFTLFLSRMRDKLHLGWGSDGQEKAHTSNRVVENHIFKQLAGQHQTVSYTVYLGVLAQVGNEFDHILSRIS